jgi:hypothetical protein
VRAVHDNNISHGVTNLKFRIKVNEGRMMSTRYSSTMCSGSVTWITDQDPTFSSSAFQMPIKIFVSSNFFRLFLFVGRFT